MTKKRVGLLFFCSWPCDVTSALFRQISDSAITLICCDGFVVHILILYRNRFVVLSMKQLDAFSFVLICGVCYYQEFRLGRIP